MRRINSWRVISSPRIWWRWSHWPLRCAWIWTLQATKRRSLAHSPLTRRDRDKALRATGPGALPAGGAAQSASLHGVSAYSGRSVLDQFDSNAATQETLSTLAADTGGKAFFDSNDFGAVFSQVQKDSSAYYVLGFTSSNKARDGRFRRLRVQVKRPNVKLDHRSGYYADRDFEHLNRTDREQQLEDELGAQLPRVDVPLYAGTAFFRKDDSHYYLAVSLVVPGSQIPFVTEKEKDNATIDIIE